MYRNKHNHFQGDHNQANETQFANHNRFVFHGEGSRAITIFVSYVVLLSLAGIVFMCIKFGNVVVISIVAGFGLGVASLFVLLGSTVVRHVSTTRAHFQIDRAQEDWHRFVHQTGVHTIVRDPITNSLSVHTLSYITENRQFPQAAQIEAPQKELDPTEVILTMWDQGSSARGIEKHLNFGKYKDEKISYRQIQKVLGLYRPGWESVHKKGDVSESYPTAE